MTAAAWHRQHQALGCDGVLRVAGGMPDLFLWNAKRKEAKLSEVKGPRDRLSEQQRAWAGALAAGGLHVEVS